MQRVCSRCGATNRIPAARLGDAARCGRCKSAFAPPAEPIEIEDPAAFDALVASSPLPVLVDFWAPWCGPCRAVAPEVARAARDLGGRAVVVKVDIDRAPALAKRYRISSIPSFAVFRNGALTGQRIGALRSPELVRLAGPPHAA